MLRVVPHIVLQNYELGNLEEEFKAYVMFADISGFTNITEKLSEYGKIGAEILTDTLNTLFAPVINSIYNSGGMITTFAGDALTAIFPGGSKAEVVSTLKSAIKEFEDRSVVSTPYGKFKFELRMGIGSGSVKLRIVDSGERAGYYFSGDAITHAVVNEEKAKKGEIVYDGISESIQGLRKSIIKPSLSTQYLFYPQEIVDGNVENAFRGVVSVFINVLPDAVTDVVEFILKEGEDVYLNKIDYGDKGFVILLVFGAPRSRKDDMERSLQFARELISKFGALVKIGMSYSVAYAGIVGNQKRSEYTVMGRGVNLAARLMQKAEYGEILIEKKLRDELPSMHFKKLGSVRLKGFSEKVEVYSPEKKSYYFVIREGERIVGQKKQKEKIRSFVRDFIEGKLKKGRIIIQGEEGSGKTTLAFYAITYARKIKPSIQYAYFDFKTHTDIPAIELFREYFAHVYGIERGDNFHSIRNKILGFAGGSLRVKRDEWEGIKYIFGVRDRDEEYDESKEEVIQSLIKRGTLLLTKNLASKGGLVVVFDGFSLMDKGARELVEYIEKNIRKGLLSILIDAREIERGDNYLLLHTSSLSQADIEKLIVHIKGKQPHSTLVEYVHSKSKGNARVATEIVKLLVERNILEDVGGYIALKKGVGGVPDSLHHIYMSRFDALPEDVRGFLKVSAIYGDRFSENIIRRAFYSGRNINNLLMYAENAGIISEEISGNYVFRDRLFRESIYQSLTYKYLRKAHKKIAKAIEKYGETKEVSVFQLFHHFYAGGMKRKAMFYGNKALKIAEMISSYERVLQITENLLTLYAPLSKKYIEITLKRATALYNLGRVAEALNVYDYVIENVKGGYLRAWALYKSAYLLSLEGKREEAERRLKDAISAGKKNKRILAMVYLNLGIIYEKNAPEKAINNLKKAIEYAKMVNDRITEASALMNLGIMFEMTGRGEEAYKLYQKAYRIYRETNYSKGVFKVYNLLANYYSDIGDLDRALKYYTKAYEYFKKFNIKTGISSILLNMGFVFAEKGKFKRSLYYYKLAERLFLESSRKSSLAIVYNNLADLYMKRGNYLKAYKYARKAVDLIEKMGSIYYGLISNITLASASVSLSKLKESEELLNKIESCIKQNQRYSFLLPYKLLIEAEFLFKKGNKSSAMLILDKLKRTTNDTSLLLKADFLRWKITRDEKLKQTLQTKLHKLLKKTDLFDYRSMLQQLSS